jgi:PPK2 family polyphosphate:nucleotide phosphotransferase
VENYHKQFIVKNGSKIKLKDFDTGVHGTFKHHRKATQQMDQYLSKLDTMQYLMFAENKRSLLIVLQGLDAAGKDGTIRHVLTGMNPQGCQVTGFKQPTPQESDHDFLWRIHPHAPAKGSVSIFNRSHYEDVLITRVHKLISEKECAKRYDLINGFEKLLVEENETVILKFFLNISKKEQLNRFAKRLDDPNRQWKISEGDYKERRYWHSYTEAYEELLHQTSHQHAPWFIIPSDHKWFRNLAISQIIAQTLENLKMKAPQATVDLDDIRRMYHRAKVTQRDLRLESERE